MKEGAFVKNYFAHCVDVEEIEEMKKREARKDRLHQNYLKRKANGKQQKRVVGLAESIER